MFRQNIIFPKVSFAVLDLLSQQMCTRQLESIENYQSSTPLVNVQMETVLQRTTPDIRCFANEAWARAPLITPRQSQ